MIEKQFTQLLQNYADMLGDRRKFAGLLKDLIPGQPLHTNLLLQLFDVDIHREIEKAVKINNSLVYRFVKRLCDEYGVSKRNADWAVAIWCTCYGETVLGKTVETVPDDAGASIDNDLIVADTVATTFDIAANDYVDDWRNVYDYEITDGGVIIKQYIVFDVDEEVTVPESIEGYPVVEIGDSAFWGCIIESIIIPPNVQSLGSYSFSGCQQLKKVQLSKFLKNIGESAFEHCNTLRFIDIPEGTKEIGKNAFINSQPYWSSYNVRIPDSVKQIGDQSDTLIENVFIEFDENSARKYGIIMGTPSFSSQEKKQYLELMKRNRKNGLTIYCKAGSEAFKYARKHDIKVDKYENYRED